MVVGIVCAVVVVRQLDWQHEPPAGIVYVWLLFVGPTAAGLSFLVAAPLRSNEWERPGAAILVGSYVARIVLGRLLRRRYPDDD